MRTQWWTVHKEGGMKVGFQYTIPRQSVEAATADPVAEIKEFALARMAEIAAAEGREVLRDTLVEQRYHAKVEIHVDEVTGEELGDLVYLPDDDPDWDTLVVRWLMDAVRVLEDLKIQSIGIIADPNLFGEHLTVRTDAPREERP